MTKEENGRWLKLSEDICCIDVGSVAKESASLLISYLFG
jgi:hypothetical protein